jgi:hypothetical protein
VAGIVNDEVRSSAGIIRHPPEILVPLLAATLAAVIVLAAPASAHDVPDAVTVHAFLKPEGTRLRLLVRVPLQAVRDVDIPRRGPGFLDLARVEPSLRHAATVWIVQNVELFEEDARVGPASLAAVRVSLPSDRSFGDYDGALAHVTGRGLDPATDLYWEQGILDALVEYPIRSEGSRFSLRPGLERLGQRVTLVLRVLPPGGGVRAFQLHEPAGLVRLDPRWHQAALSFTWAGFRHVLDGADHLLFLLCVVIPVRRLRPLVIIVTSFTVAHSITLVGSAYGAAPGAIWFVPLVETLIALSIVYMALENIVIWLDRRAVDGTEAGRVERVALGRRWIVTGLFGLVHGFGFSFALRDNLQFAGSHLLTSLVSFNVGVELAQLLVIAVCCAALSAAFAFVVSERAGAVILSALVAHTGWHWTGERGRVLAQFSWPEVDAALLASAVGWVLAAVVAASLIWAARAAQGWRGLTSRLSRRRAEPGARPS